MGQEQRDKFIGVRVTTPLWANLRRVAGNDRKISEEVRKAIRFYLDNQADLAGSRRYFTGQFKERVENLERMTSWHLSLLTVLIAEIGSILILNLIEIREEDRKNFTSSALLKIAEERLIDSGWRVRRRIAAAANEAELVEMRQRDKEGR
jgi:hypothetical protein